MKLGYLIVLLLFLAVGAKAELRCSDIQTQSVLTGFPYRVLSTRKLDKMSEIELEQLRKALRLHFQNLDDERWGLVTRASLAELNELGDRPYAMTVEASGTQFDVINFASGDNPFERWFFHGSRDLIPITVDDGTINCRNDDRIFLDQDQQFEVSRVAPINTWILGWAADACVLFGRVGARPFVLVSGISCDAYPIDPKKPMILKLEKRSIFQAGPSFHEMFKRVATGVDAVWMSEWPLSP